MSLLSAERPSIKQKALKAVTNEPEIKTTTFNFPAELHKQFKIKCLQNGENMTDVLIKLISEYINK